jgi:hypothetical protein
MIDQLSLDQARLLTQIARRKDPSILMWFDMEMHSTLGDQWTCHICQEKIVLNYTFREIDLHGIQHLRDSNLLPFL